MTLKASEWYHWYAIDTFTSTCGWWCRRIGMRVIPALFGEWKSKWLWRAMCHFSSLSFHISSNLLIFRVNHRKYPNESLGDLLKFMKLWWGIERTSPWAFVSNFPFFLFLTNSTPLSCCCCHVRLQPEKLFSYWYRHVSTPRIIKLIMAARVYWNRKLSFFFWRRPREFGRMNFLEIENFNGFARNTLNFVGCSISFKSSIKFYSFPGILEFGSVWLHIKLGIVKLHWLFN